MGFIALGPDGYIWGCGENVCGQLDSTKAAFRTAKAIAKVPTGPFPYMAVTCGTHSMVMAGDGSIWGNGDGGQGGLGPSHSSGTGHFVRIEMPSGSRPIYITAGTGYSIVTFENGEAWGCGSNYYGEIGVAHSASYRSWYRVCIPDDFKIARCITTKSEVKGFVTPGTRRTLYECTDNSVWVSGQMCAYKTGVLFGGSGTDGGGSSAATRHTPVRLYPEIDPSTYTRTDFLCRYNLFSQSLDMFRFNCVDKVPFALSGYFSNNMFGVSKAFYTTTTGSAFTKHSYISNMWNGSFTAIEWDGKTRLCEGMTFKGGTINSVPSPGLWPVYVKGGNNA
jgi:hypothetical protein